MTGTAGLPTLWRERAELLDRHGAHEAADTLRVSADELEAGLAADAEATITVTEAAEIAEVSDRTVRYWIATGRLPAVPGPGRTRVPRAALPAARRSQPDRGYDPRAHALDIARTHGGAA